MNQPLASDPGRLACDEPVVWKRQRGIVATYRMVDGRQLVRVRLLDAEGRPYGAMIEGPSSDFQRAGVAGAHAGRA